MTRRLKIDDSVRAIAMAPDRLLVVSEMTHDLFVGRPYVLVLPFLDGRNSARDIVGRLEGELSAVDVYGALAVLESTAHVVVEADARSSTERPDVGREPAVELPARVADGELVATGEYLRGQL